MKYKAGDLVMCLDTDWIRNRAHVAGHFSPGMVFRIGSVGAIPDEHKPVNSDGDTQYIYKQENCQGPNCGDTDIVLIGDDELSLLIYEISKELR